MLITVSLFGSLLVGHIQKRALRFVLDDYKTGYTDLLENANVPGIKIMVLRYIAIEVFKCNMDIQIKYGLPYCVTCPSMSTDLGSLNPGMRRSRIPGWWDPGVRTNTGAGDTVLAKHT